MQTNPSLPPSRYEAGGQTAPKPMGFRPQVSDPWSPVAKPARWLRWVRSAPIARTPLIVRGRCSAATGRPGHLRAEVASPSPSERRLSCRPYYHRAWIDRRAPAEHRCRPQVCQIATACPRTMPGRILLIPRPKCLTAGLADGRKPDRAQSSQSQLVSTRTSSGERAHGA